MINWTSSNPKRAGIILYDKDYYYLGIDTITGDVTDFGGRIIYSYEDAISGAIREFQEETLFCFPKVEWLDIYNSEVLIDHDIAIFLVKIDYNFDEYKKIFDQKQSLRIHSEIRDIIKIRKNDRDGGNYRNRKNEDGANDEKIENIYPLIKNCLSEII